MASNYSPDPKNIVSLGNPVTPQSGQDSGAKVPEFSASIANPYSSNAAKGQSPQTPVSNDNRGDFRRLPAGTLLSAGRYKIEQSVAAGGMGAVYRAIDVRFDDEPCAVKEMLDDFQKDVDRNQAVEWFKREAKLLLKLNHSYIPRVRDSFVENDRHYLVMDFIEGRTLTELLEKEGNVPGLEGAHGVSEARARSWAQQLCNVLAYLHRQNPPIIFRDLKPSNIMVTDQDEIRLIDFGIARTFQSQRQSTIIMTIGYAPPEQLHGMPEPRSDLYALGATLHRVLTHHDAANNKPGIFSFPPVRTLRPDISMAFEQVIMKALAPAIEQRWIHAAEMEKAIINLSPIRIAPPIGAIPPQGQLPPTIAQPPSAPYPTAPGSADPYSSYGATPKPADPYSSYGATPKTADPYSPYPAQPVQATPNAPYYAPPEQATPYAPYPTAPPKSRSANPLQEVVIGAKKLAERFRAKETQLSLFAITRADLEQGDQALIGKAYTVQAGISQSRPEHFRAEPFDLSVRNPEALLSFDILLHTSENIELTTAWQQHLQYDPRNS